MNELNELLNKIMEVAKRDISNDDKHKLLSKLWTKYYKISRLLNVELEEEHNINSLLETCSYVVKQETTKKEIDYDLLYETIDKIKNNCGITEKEAINMLDWTINNAKENLSTVLCHLTKDVENHTLAGFCQVSQSLTLIPLENIGVKVTKNNITDCFDCPYAHAFGTATFNIINDNNIVEKTYLIDATYRQFLTTSKCNEGMYYKKDSIAPDPGYFVDKTFAKILLKNGYILLNEKTAELYGLPFYQSTIPLKGKKEKRDFYNNIINGYSNYCAEPSDIEGFNLEFPKKAGINHY